MMSNLIRNGLLTAIVFVLPFSCAKNSLPESDPGVETMILSARLAHQETKTMLGVPSAGVCPVLWKTGDRVSVNGVVSDNAVTAGENGTKDVDFTISSPVSAPYKVL